MILSSIRFFFRLKPLSLWVVLAQQNQTRDRSLHYQSIAKIKSSNKFEKGHIEGRTYLSLR